MDINRRLRKFTWRIENFSSIEDKKLYSNNFDVGDTRWRLLIFPKGNRADYLSIYVDVADSATLPCGWSRYAQFRLAVVNQIDRKSSITKVARHEFNAKENDRGFTRFLPLSELHDPKKGYLMDDACLVEADISTDGTIDWESHEFIVEARSDELKCMEADCGKAEIDSQKTLVTKPEETTTPSPAILAAPIVASSPGQDKANSTGQNLPTAQSSSQSETIEPEDPSGKDMDSFFTSLESKLALSNTVSSEEEAKEALAKIEKALNMDPANFYDSGEFSPLNQAFKILSNFDCSSTLTIEQKNQLLAMEENFKELPDRAAKAVQDKNLVTEKESVKLTLTRNLERSVIKFKEAKAEVKQVEQKIAALHEQVDEAQKKRENILAELKQIFKISKELKMELEALEKQWPEYEAKAKLAEEEEKTVEAEWGRMKDFISSMCSFATTAPGTTNYLSDKTDKENTLNGIFRISEISCPVSTSTSAGSIFKFGASENGSTLNNGSVASSPFSFSSLMPSLVSNNGQCSSSSSTNYMSFTTNSDTLAAATTSTNSNVNAASTTASTEASVSSFTAATVFKFASSGDPSASVSTLSATSGEATEAKTQDTSSGNVPIIPFGSTSAFPTSGSNIICGTSAVTGTVSSTSGCTTAVVTSFGNSSFSGTSSNITNSRSGFVSSTFSTGTNPGNGIFSGTSATTDTGSSVFGGTSLSIASTGSSIFSSIPAITSTGSNLFLLQRPHQ
ncbi:nuclear pore complex protein NUP1-like isoform X2 [Durio zibethinus]|nr:nuclear pore complex protein NUP1-like isoform X2 [Durio zibethinus]